MDDLFIFMPTFGKAFQRIPKGIGVPDTPLSTRRVHVDANRLQAKETFYATNLHPVGWATCTIAGKKNLACITFPTFSTVTVWRSTFPGRDMFPRELPEER